MCVYIGRYAVRRLTPDDRRFYRVASQAQLIDYQDGDSHRLRYGIRGLARDNRTGYIYFVICSILMGRERSTRGCDLACI
jgi:hypothetical protein